MPSIALREWLRLPVGTLEAIIEYRAYEQAYGLVEQADTAARRKALPKTAMVDLARLIEMELMQEAMEHRE